MVFQEDNAQSERKKGHCKTTNDADSGTHSCSLAQRLRLDVMSFDHAVECFSIHTQHSRGRLFVSACVLEHFGNVPALDHR